MEDCVMSSDLGLESSKQRDKVDNNQAYSVTGTSVRAYNLESDSVDSDDSRPRKIFVSGLPPSTHEEHLELLFENTRKQGGGAVTSVVINHNKATAIVEFDEPEAVDIVLKKLPIKVLGTKVNVELFQEQPPDATVHVRHLNKGMDDEMLQSYFESKHRSGGGPVKHIDRINETMVRIIFESDKDSQEVLNRDHCFKGEVFEVFAKVQEEQQNVVYEDTIMVEGVNEWTTRDCLFYFMESKIGVPPDNIMYSEEKGVVMVKFGSNIDFTKIKRLQTELDGSAIQLTRVPVSRCIFVTGLTEDMSEHTVQFYFENHRRSGGGNVEKVEMNDDGKSCFVYFEDIKEIENVLKRPHTIGNTHLIVAIYYDRFGHEAKERAFHPKFPVAIPIDPHVMTFMTQSTVWKDTLYDKLTECGAVIKWPQEEADRLNVEFDLKGLRKKTQAVVDDFLKDVVIMKRDFDEDIFDSIQDKRKVLAFEEKETDTTKREITIVGLKSDTEKVFENMKIKRQQKRLRKWMGDWK